MSDNAAAINPAEDPWGIPATSVSWDVVPPFTITGLVTGQEMAQQTSFDDKKPLFWEDGRPRKKVIVSLQCKPDNRLDITDDGKRSLHMRIPSALFAAVREAINEAGLKTLPTGGTHTLTVTYTKDGEQSAADKRAKRNPPKEFVALLLEATDSDESAAEPPF